MEDLARYATETASPLERIEGRLNLWVAFGIVPLFALANAASASTGARSTGGCWPGSRSGSSSARPSASSAARLAVRVGVGRLPSSATWRHMFGLAVTAGIGFTVALFVTGLSFTDPALDLVGEDRHPPGQHRGRHPRLRPAADPAAVPVAAPVPPAPADASAGTRSDPVGQSSGASSR